MVLWTEMEELEEEEEEEEEEVVVVVVVERQVKLSAMAARRLKSMQKMKRTLAARTTRKLE